MRLFVAVTLGAAIEAQVRTALEHLKGLAPRARWVPPENLHLTLSFLGEVASERVPALAEALQRVGEAHAPLVLSVCEGGSFGSPSHPRVLWADIRGDTAALGALQAAVVEALKPLGFPPEERAFTAHLTLARARVPRGDQELTECVRALRGSRWGETRVDRLVLFESLHGRYVSRAEAPLSKAPPPAGA